MLLRSKRRLTQPGVRRKRLKSSKADREPLYLNNAVQSELMKLRKVGRHKAEKIMKERENGPFRSQRDLIARISCVTEISIEDSPVRLIFDTEYQLECNEISHALSSINSFKSYSTAILMLIAELSIGRIYSCDNPKCDREILISKEHRLRSGLIQKGNEYERFLHIGHSGFISTIPKVEYFLWFDPLAHMEGTYYYRKNEKYGDAVFCTECTKGLDQRCCATGPRYAVGTDERTRNCVFITDRNGRTMCECAMNTDRKEQLKKRYMKLLPRIQEECMNTHYCKCRSYKIDRDF